MYQGKVNKLISETKIKEYQRMLEKNYVIKLNETDSERSNLLRVT